MYLHQHPSYNRISSHFSARRNGGRGRHGHSAATDAQSYRELTQSDFTQWKCIGRGGFGRVYKVVPRDSNILANYSSEGLKSNEAAIKVVDKKMLKDSAAEQRLATEVAIHESLHHPGIVRVLDSFEDDRYVYLVLEYCNNGDLWKYLRARRKYSLNESEEPYPYPADDSADEEPTLAPLSEGEARFLMLQISRAIAHLHENGILHRDLKLANLLLTKSMDVKIADFGLATWIRDTMTEPMTLCGTPSYISPEILARQPYGFESDIWALGCLFVTFLTGHQPFKGQNRITEQLVSQIRLPRDISRESRHMIKSLLRVNPRQRIRSDELLNHPFFSPRLATRALIPLFELSSSSNGGGSAIPRPSNNARISAVDNTEDRNRTRQRQKQTILPPRRHPPNINPISDRYSGGAPMHNIISRNYPPIVSNALAAGNQRFGGRASHPDEDEMYTEAMQDHITDSAPLASLARSRPYSTGTNQYNGRATEAEAKHQREPHKSSGTRRSELKSSYGTNSTDSNMELEYLSTRRLEPMKKTIENGKLYIRNDGLLVLDMMNMSTLVALDEKTRHIHEFKRNHRLQELGPHLAIKTHPWDVSRLPKALGKCVRVACRCVDHLLSKQPRIRISTPQGKGYLFENLPNAHFRFAFINGIRVTLSRRDQVAKVEIPSKDDMPDEIQKIPLSKSDCLLSLSRKTADDDNDDDDGGVGSSPLDFTDISLTNQDIQSSGSKVPDKIRGIYKHVKEALRRCLDADRHIREFEPNGSLFSDYSGDIHYPVIIEWDQTLSGFVPAGLRHTLARKSNGLARHTTATSITNTTGSSTAVVGSGTTARASEERLRSRILARDPKPNSWQQWAPQKLDHRIIEDTPTRRLNMGPITRLVEEFNQPDSDGELPPIGNQPMHRAQGARGAEGMAGALFRTPATRIASNPSSDESESASIRAQRSFEDACFLANAGWCLFSCSDSSVEGVDENCIFTILFLDGCKLFVRQRDQTITYCDADGGLETFPINQMLPRNIKERVRWLPHFLTKMGFEV